jgi:uncharacterized membrane protein
MKSNLSGAFSRGFWNGFCSPMLLFDASGESAFSRGFWNGFCSPWRRSGGERKNALLLPAKPERSVRWIEGLPSANALEELERMVPGGANRLMKMIEQEHEVRMERRRYSVRESIYGHWMGFALVILSVVAGVTTAFMQCPWQVSVAFVSVPLLGVVRVFVPRGRSTS